MEAGLNFSDLQHIIGVKLCFFGFITMGLLAIYYKWKPWIFLLITGGLCALAYYILVDNLWLMFWGLRGDEVTITAMYEMFAHGSLFSDFAYANLPPFYPALFFQAFALLGRWFGLNGVQVAKLATASTILLLPALVYSLQELYWKVDKSRGDKDPGTITYFLSALLMFVVIDWDAIIMKPYELVSAVFVILWTVFLLHDVHNKNISWKRILIYGVTGGILFLLFYFWFFLAAIGVALFNLFYSQKTTLKKYGQFALVGLMIIIIGSAYWLPLAISYKAFGAENWQIGFFIIEWIATHGPTFDFSLRGLILLGGLVALIAYRKRFYARGLLSLFVASYVWQAMGMFAILFFASPLQESKGFFFFNRVVLVFALSYGIERLWKWSSIKFEKKLWQKSVMIIGVLFLSTQLIFGTFTDKKEVMAVRDRARVVSQEMNELISFLNSNYDVYEKKTLSSGIPELHAFLPLNVVFYFNQHNSHPAAGFSNRVLFLKELSFVSDSKLFFENLDNSIFGRIDLFVFEKDGEPGYPIYYILDNFPYGIESTGLRFGSGVFVKPYVKKVFENNKYIVFENAM